MPVTAKPQQLHGVAISGSSSFLAWILDVNLSGMRRGKLETTNSATTTQKTFRAEQLFENGELRCTIQFDSSKTPPIASAEETWTITWPMASGAATAASLSGTGFMTSFDMTGAIGSIMTANVTISWSGALTWTAAA